MFGFIANKVGGLVRDAYEGAAMLVEDVGNIGEELAKGWESGLITNPEQEVKQSTKENKTAEVSEVKSSTEADSE